jgi:hypothetical protein
MKRILFMLVMTAAIAESLTAQTVKIRSEAMSLLQSPKIMVTEPQLTRGLRAVATNSTTMRGKIVGESGNYTVLVNDVPAKVSGDGQFEATLKLKQGSNPVRVVAKDMRYSMTSSENFSIDFESKMQEPVVAKAVESLTIEGKYHALFIGIQDYDPNSGIRPLEAPIQDAEKVMNALLANYTFEKEYVTFLKNPDRSTIIRTLDALSNKLTEKDNLLIFYAGHGYWDERLKQGFWLPKDAERGNRSNWLPNSDVKTYIGGIKTKHTLLISDACFSGGIFKTRQAFGAATQAIAQIYSLPSRKAMSSGAMTEVPDKSVFVEYLLRRLNETPDEYIPAEWLFSNMKQAVVNNSTTNQVPQYGEIRETGDEGGDFIFVKRKK